MLETASLSEYIKKSNEYFNEEKRRCEIYLNWDIKEKLLDTFRKEMLIKEYNSLFERQTGIKYLLN